MLKIANGNKRFSVASSGRLSIHFKTGPGRSIPLIRKCEDKDFEALYEIINDAAQAYKGVIPADRWHEPYMAKEELRRGIQQGVEFWGYEEKGLFPSQGSGGAYRTIAEKEIGEGKWMKTGLEKSFSACPLSCERFPAL